MKLIGLKYEFGNFNNKSYRIYDSKDEWLTSFQDVEKIFTHTNINFNIGNGVSTSHEGVIIGDENYSDVNYLMVYQDSGVFHSSWFVMSTTYINNNNYSLSLKRDMISENIYDLRSSRGLVKRGSIEANKKSILQVQDENIFLGKYKTGETLLLDEFKRTQWLVSFWTDNKMNGTEEGKVEIHESYSQQPFNLQVPDIEQWEFYKYTQEKAVTEVSNIEGELDTYLNYNTGDERKKRKGFILKLNDLYNDNIDILPYERYYTSPWIEYLSETYAKNTGPVVNKLKDFFWNYRNSIRDSLNIKVIDQGTTTNLLSLDQKIIKDNKTGKHYLITLQIGTENIVKNYNTNLKNSDLIPDIKDMLIREQNYIVGNRIESIFTKQGGTSGLGRANTGGSLDTFIDKISYIGSTIKMELTQLEATEIDLVMDSAIRLDSEPFKMIVIPVSDTLKVSTDDNIYKLNSLMAYQTMSSLIAKYGGTSGGLLDIQLIPYSPSATINDLLINTTIMYDNYGEDKYKYKIISEDSIVPIFNIRNNNHTFIINQPDYTIFDYKRQYLTETLRFTSGSYKSVFDFNHVLNDGFKGVTVNMTLKPFDSFIHITPKFDWLYGLNFKDIRGLVISEDLSMTKATSEWENFKLQNRNFQNSFNLTQDAERSALNINQSYMDKNLRLNNKETIIGSAIGAANLLVQGASSLNPIGGMIGAGVGTGILAGATAMQIGLNNERNQMNKGQQIANMNLQQDTAKRQFTMNLDNIKALPQNITKINGFNLLSKYWPIIELYSTSDEEMTILNRYLKLNGQFINTMGILHEYMNISNDYDYIEFVPYINNIYTNAEMNLEMNNILGSGIYLCYTNELPGQFE